ncbi:MAG: membrane dipeptidase [Proteobacteria bacterium]|nr:membrane dipeptidase [Pseudomonadota bacterium]
MTAAASQRPNDRLIWDMIVPLAPIVGNDMDLLSRYHASGHGFISLTIAGDDCGLAEAIHRLARARADIAARSESLLLATCVKDIFMAREQGKLAVGLHLEGTECLERDPEVLTLLYVLGIRHGILAFNQNNSASGGCADLGNVGISRIGRRYLEKMRDLGMLLDASHMSERASLEAIEFIGRPVVFTHSNARALHDHYRNVTDEQARACATSGGLVGISGSSAYLGEFDNLAEGMFRHLDYFVQMLGEDHVGIGTDYVVDAEIISRIFAERVDEWPITGVADYGKIAYLPPEELSIVIEQMEKAGYGEPAIRKILGGNYLRIAQRVWL